MSEQPEPEDYPHNEDNVTCPGPGIKCACWDLEHDTAYAVGESDE